MTTDPDPAVAVELARRATGRITGWKIAVDSPDLGYAEVSGWVSIGRCPEDAALRYIDAIADGLRRAGYDPQVTLERTTSEER